MPLKHALQLGLFILLLSILFFSSPVSFDDFRVYFTAGQKCMNGLTVYDVPGHFQYKYAPIIALLFGFLSSPFSFSQAAWGFSVLNIALWFSFIFLLTRKVRQLVPNTRLSENELALSALLFVTISMRWEFVLGQVNVIPLLLMLGAFESLEYKYKRLTPSERFLQDGLTALLWALALAFKLHWALAGAAFFWRREWRVLILAPIILVGLHLPWASGELIAWARTLTASTSHLIGSFHDVSLLGIITKFSQRLPHSALIAKTIWGAAVIAFFIFSHFFRKMPAFLSYAFTAGALLALTPIAWAYWISFSLPAALLLAAKYFETHNPTQWNLNRVLFFSAGILLVNSQNSFTGNYFALTLIALLIEYRLVSVYASDSKKA